MPQSLYAPNIHTTLDPKAVLERLRRDGWDPIPITDPPGYTYPPHSHAETKLLAILSGSMEVRIEGDVYRCLPGDQIVIPGGVEHAALVGPNGCTFYWSEQLR
jgi:mannose-6-phosphate isomerase-like protein (cupin superfamily)